MADSILHIASNYPQQQTVQVPIQKSRSAPYHVPRSPHYNMQSGSPNQSPMGGSMNRHMGYPSPSSHQQQQSRTSPISPMLMHSPVSHQSNQSLPSPGSMHSPTSGIRSPIPTPPPGYHNVGLRSPCDMQQMASPMGTAQSMRSPGHMPPINMSQPIGSPAGRSCSSGNMTSPGQHQQHFSPNPLNSPSSHVGSPYTPSSKAHISSPPQSQSYQNISSSTSPSPYISDMSSPDPGPRSGVGPSNPLQSLQKLVMLPETQVVDPKSVVNDACLPSPQSNEGSKNCDDSAEQPSGEACGSTAECSNSNSTDRASSSQSPPCTDGKHCNEVGDHSEDKLSSVKNQNESMLSVKDNVEPTPEISEKFNHDSCTNPGPTVSLVQEKRSPVQNCDNQEFKKMSKDAQCPLIETPVDSPNSMKLNLESAKKEDVTSPRDKNLNCDNTKKCKQDNCESIIIEPKLVNGDIDHCNTTPATSVRMNSTSVSGKVNNVMNKKAENHRTKEATVKASDSKESNKIGEVSTVNSVDEKKGKKRGVNNSNDKCDSQKKARIVNSVNNDEMEKHNDSVDGVEEVETLRVRKDSGNTYSRQSRSSFLRSDELFSDFGEELDGIKNENCPDTATSPTSNSGPVNSELDTSDVSSDKRTDKLPSKSPKQPNVNKKMNSVTKNTDLKETKTNMANSFQDGSSSKFPGSSKTKETKNKCNEEKKLPSQSAHSAKSSDKTKPASNMSYDVEVSSVQIPQTPKTISSAKKRKHTTNSEKGKKSKDNSVSTDNSTNGVIQSQESKPPQVKKELTFHIIEEDSPMEIVLLSDDSDIEGKSLSMLNVKSSTGGIKAEAMDYDDSIGLESNESRDVDRKNNSNVAETVDTSPNSDKKKRGRPVGSKNKAKVKEKERSGKKKKKNKPNPEEDSFKMMKFNKTLEAMKKKKRSDGIFSSGPFIRVEGPRSHPASVKVFNDTPTDDLDSKLGKKKASKGLVSSAPSLQISNLPTEKSVMLPSQKLTSDTVWVCALCGKHSSYKILGDLFGPYYIESHLALLKSEEESKKEELLKKKTPESTPTGEAGGNSRRSRRRTSNERRSSSGMSVSEPPLPKPKEVWVHEDCVMWTDGVFLIGSKIYGLEEAVKVAGSSVCNIFLFLSLIKFCGIFL